MDQRPILAQQKNYLLSHLLHLLPIFCLLEHLSASTGWCYMPFSVIQITHSSIFLLYSYLLGSPYPGHNADSSQSASGLFYILQTLPPSEHDSIPGQLFVFDLYHQRKKQEINHLTTNPKEEKYTNIIPPLTTQITGTIIGL